MDHRSGPVSIKQHSLYTVAVHFLFFFFKYFNKQISILQKHISGIILQKTRLICFNDCYNYEEQICRHRRKTMPALFIGILLFIIILLLVLRSHSLHYCGTKQSYAHFQRKKTEGDLPSREMAKQLMFKSDVQTNCSFFVCLIHTEDIMVCFTVQAHSESTLKPMDINQNIN